MHAAQKLVRRKLALILPMTFWESRRRDQGIPAHPMVSMQRSALDAARQDGWQAGLPWCHSTAQQRLHDALWLVYLQTRVQGRHERDPAAAARLMIWARILCSATI
jgi:hypothetical protein